MNDFEEVEHEMGRPAGPSSPAHREFDYADPALENDMMGITALVLTIHAEIQKKTVLYERTLGLAVIPSLLRWMAIRAYRKVRAWRQGSR